MSECDFSFVPFGLFVLNEGEENPKPSFKEFV